MTANSLVHAADPAVSVHNPKEHQGAVSAWSEVAQGDGIPGAGRQGNGSPRSSQQHDAESGLEISPVHFLTHVNIHSLIGHDPFKPLNLTRELFEPFRIISLYPAILIPPTVIRLLGDLEMLTHLDHRLTLTKHPVSLPQLTNNLLRGVMLSLHIFVPHAHKGNRGLIQSWRRKQGSSQRGQYSHESSASVGQKKRGLLAVPWRTA